LNFLTIVFVARKIIIHARHATTRHQSFERAKRCVLVLLSSCITQGIGWLFGPFLTFVDPNAGNVLEWFFIVFNGLEGLWSLLLYYIIRQQGMDEKKRVSAAAELTKTSSLSEAKYRTSQKKIERGRDGNDDDERRREGALKQRNLRESAHTFDDLREIEDRHMEWPVHEESSTSL